MYRTTPEANQLLPAWRKPVAAHLPNVLLPAVEVADDIVVKCEDNVCVGDFVPFAGKVYDSTRRHLLPCYRYAGYRSIKILTRNIKVLNQVHDYAYILV